MTEPRDTKRLERVLAIIYFTAIAIFMLTLMTNGWILWASW